jgi:hypothetical protein
MLCTLTTQEKGKRAAWWIRESPVTIILSCPLALVIPATAANVTVGLCVLMEPSSDLPAHPQIVANPPTYPNFLRFLKLLKIPILDTQMTFSVSRDRGAFEWAGDGLGALFCQVGNLCVPPRSTTLCFSPSLRSSSWAGSTRACTA